MNEYDAFLERLAREHAAEVDADKLELTLWALTRGTERAEARTRRHPRGIELVVTIDGELQGSWTFNAGQLDALEALEQQVHRSYLGDGWQDAGPRQT